MAVKRPYAATIKIENLLLDERNPRLPKPLPQDEALLKFAAQPKTIKLAEHLTKNGPNPLDIIGVITADKRGRYIVKEGNRRVAALRLLKNPHLAGSDRLTSKYRTLAKDATVKIDGDVPVVVFPDEKSVNEWIVVKHSGELGGAGTVPWDAMEKARFNMRAGNPDQYASAYLFLDNAVAQDWITEDEANNVNVSNLARVLKDTGVQEVLNAADSPTSGIEFRLAGEGPKKLAKRLAQDWRRDALTVERIYKSKDRRDYAETLKNELTLEPSGEPHGAGARRGASPKTGAGSTRTRRSAAERRKLVPNSYQISIPDDLRRTAHVLREMKTLDIHKFPNAAACLFRTFIETSVNLYIQKHSVAVHPREDKLGARTEKVIAHLRQANPNAQHAIKPVKAALSKDFSIFSIGTLHEYVHNPRWHPEPDDLLKHWDNYGPFLALLWE